MNTNNQKIRYLSDHSIAEELNNLGKLSDAMYGVIIATTSVQRFRDYCAAYGIDPSDFVSASALLRKEVQTLARRNGHTEQPQTVNQEAA
jgi:hypothetical protein